jgi:6-phosphogluconolactonase
LKHTVFVSLSGEDRIAIFSLDSQTGHLESIGNVEIEGRPAPLAVDPSGAYLYAGLRSSCHIASFEIDRTTWNLSLFGKTPLESDPCFLATDRTGRFLFSTYYAAGALAVHRIDPGGVIHNDPIESIKTAKNAHSMQTDPTNTYAYVPHTGANIIIQFSFDAETGHLAEKARFAPEKGQGPRHFCFHPGKKYVYFVNEQGCSISAYRLDSSTGAISPVQTVSTLPEGFSGKNTCAQIHMSRDGKLLFASNRGHDSIAAFSIAQDSGKLTPIGQTATEKTPRAFNLDPQDRFLLAAGLDSGKMAVYGIGPQSGALLSHHTLTVGAEPMWVLIL